MTDFRQPGGHSLRGRQRTRQVLSPSSFDSAGKVVEAASDQSAVTIEGGGAAKVSEANRALRRKNRSLELVQAIQQLDATTDPATLQKLIDWIRDYYAEKGGGDLIGLFAQCYLGHPYVDHQLTLGHQILQHFTPDDAVPPAFAAARSLVRSPAYLFVEVYSDGAVVPVRANGEAAI